MKEVSNVCKLVACIRKPQKIAKNPRKWWATILKISEERLLCKAKLPWKLEEFLTAVTMTGQAIMPRGCNSLMRTFAVSQSPNEVSKDKATLTLSPCWVSWGYHSKVWEVGVFLFEIPKLRPFSKKTQAWERERFGNLIFKNKGHQKCLKVTQRPWSTTQSSKTKKETPVF